MSEEKKHIIYSAEDIKRYLTGGMPPAEMHAIEMAALDDPLLAEAMEGYELMEEKDWSKELAALKEQLNKNEEAPVIPIVKAASFKWLKAAAAVIVLGVTATTAYIFTNKNKTEASSEIAKIETAVADSAAVAKTDSVKAFLNTAPADSSSQLIAKLDKVTYTNSAATIVTAGSTAYSTVTDSKQQSDSSFIYQPSAGRNDYAVNDKAVADVSREKEYKAADEVAAAPGSVAGNSNVTLNERDFKNKAEEGIIALDKKSNNSNNGFALKATNNFSGVVVTPDNKPVSWANIKVPQNKKPVYTDANGAFHFTAADTAPNVTIASAGFTTQKFTLQNSAAQNKIVLQPQDVAIQKVGVYRKAKAASKREVSIADSTDIDDDDAEPAGGWVEYNNYLSNNLKFPDEAKQRNIHGEVEVTVKLKNNGDISQVKVAKPLSPECDAEAVRLVKEGPKWDVKGNKKTKVKVKVTF